ncbi:YwpF family protein [Caldibacillus debilis]|uniref:YwpF family protein n=1 Tax=Caldibacillus debilis TaxID=301148 RepID=UPI000B5753F0|nr:YwpF family protein [Caldibacillus debilis]OUM84026.1 MAG: hypothetical protein BAA03_06840 [Caldibacillus debilis]
MKTFKLADFQLIGEDGLTPVPFEDGLAINQENEENTWLIEIFLKKTDAERFRLADKDEKFRVQAIITKRENDPAYFSVKLVSYTEMDDFATVLFRGKLSGSRNYYAVSLLECLLNQNLQGEELLEAFKEGMKKKLAVRAPRSEED